MKVTIDRFEGAFAVLELGDRETVTIPAALLPEGAQEGDVLEIRILKKEGQDREKRIQALMDSVFE